MKWAARTNSSTESEYSVQMLDGAVRQNSSDEFIHRSTHYCASARKPRPLRRGRLMAPAVVAFAVTPRFPSLRAVRAVAGDAEDEWGKEPADQGGAASTVAEAPVASEVAEMKVNLKEALYGTERGLRASSETQVEVVEIITLNPMPAPTEALTLLNGKWILAYTAFIPLYP